MQVGDNIRCVDVGAIEFEIVYNITAAATVAERTVLLRERAIARQALWTRSF